MKNISYLPLKYIWFLIIPLFLYIFAGHLCPYFCLKKVSAEKELLLIVSIIVDIVLKNNPLGAQCVVLRAIVVK